MGADLTRDTFHLAKHFRRVLSQQGRVLLDADFNEQAAILLHYLESLAQDLIGPYGGPKTNEGFGIKIDVVNNTLTIGQGRYYVQGMQCENEIDGLAYQEQDGFSILGPPALSTFNYVYLDVWERLITSVQDDEIRESALGGPDTCARSKIVWQVKLGKDSTTPTDCTSLRKWLQNLPAVSDAALEARVTPRTGGDTDPCSIPPSSRYRGLENQLYRVEIHRSGGVWDGSSGNAASAATFKWSRDNGSVVFPIVSENGKVVTVQSLGRDATMSLEVDDWVEIVDDDVELVGKQPGILSGILGQVDAVDPVSLTVTLRPPADVSTVSWPSYDANSTNHPFLRRWDQRVADGLTFSEGAILITENTGDDSASWISIEDGIEVQFQPPNSGAAPRFYRSGDYWLIPARVATGNIEWPVGSAGKPEALPPSGIVHVYAPLGMIADGSDCRCAFTAPCNPNLG